MNTENENNKFDISRRDGKAFKHYHIMVKLMQNDRTEHHNVEIFTGDPQHLLEMRRIYTSTCTRMSYQTICNISKNN